MESIRHAESSRSSSCDFADAIASISIETYKNYCPDELQKNYLQTVLAAVVLLNRNIVTEHNHSVDPCEKQRIKRLLKVISIGVGTKVLSAEIIESRRGIDSKQQTDRKINTSSGSQVAFSNINSFVHLQACDNFIRDMHAEILARRGFLKFLSLEIERIFRDSDQTSPSIFEVDAISGRLKLKTGYSIHLYSSSQPCGNSTIKKWAKSHQTEPMTLINKDELYCHEIHPPLAVTARVNGQVALLVKKNRMNKLNIIPHLNQQRIEAPSGTSYPDQQQGNIMSCSDKIALWNSIGIQGTFLSNFYVLIYLETITIGRKFSKIHCQRALCCRLQSFQQSFQLSVATAAASSRSWKTQLMHTMFTETSSSDSQLFEVNYFTHHPVMLGTSVKFDEGIIHTASSSQPIHSTSTQDMNLDSCQSVGGTASSSNIKPSITIGAQFNESRCFSGYLVPSQEDAGHESFQTEVIDGQSGYISESNTLTNPSKLSSSSLMHHYYQIYLSLLQEHHRISCPEGVPMDNCPSCLQKVETIHSMDYKTFKKLGKFSQLHQRSKWIIQHDPVLFQGWIDKTFPDNSYSTSKG